MQAFEFSEWSTHRRGIAFLCGAKQCQGWYPGTHAMHAHDASMQNVAPILEWVPGAHLHNCLGAFAIVEQFCTWHPFTHSERPAAWGEHRVTSHHAATGQADGICGKLLRTFQQLPQPRRRLDEINNSAIQRSGARGTRLGKLYLLDRCLPMGGTDTLTIWHRYGAEWCPPQRAPSPSLWRSTPVRGW